MLKTFIERPVLSTVVSIVIVILGILGLSTLPIEQYPDIAPPTIQVTATYPGASAETILESVIIPIEEQINGVEGMTYITSDATNNGTANITVFFDQDVDPDIAAVNVQNRVARANPLLPQEVIQTGVQTQKQQTSALMFMSVLYSIISFSGFLFCRRVLLKLLQFRNFISIRLEIRSVIHTPIHNSVLFRSKLGKLFIL
jgi:HAE1 family hydrophobic/amphiphilic exporter-1